MGRLKLSLQGARSSDRRIPLARTEDLAIEEFEDELLVYDRKEQRAHCLGPTAARVWRACDGRTDVGRLAEALELSQDTVRRALDELEASQLLDVPEVQVLDGNGSGNDGITRRQLTVRSAKIGAAAGAAPLIYSIAVPTPAAAASPTEHACAVYSVSSCGTSGGAAAIAGCCCCCGGCSASSCAVGAPRGMCYPGSIDCPANCGTASCTGGQGTTPPSPAGCCGSATSTTSNCGCAWAYNSSQGAGAAGNTCGNYGQSCPTCPTGGLPGAAGCGAGCCDATTGAGCVPGSANCVPCCNGSPIPDDAAFGCCVPGTANTCT